MCRHTTSGNGLTRFDGHRAHIEKHARSRENALQFRIRRHAVPLGTRLRFRGLPQAVIRRRKPVLKTSRDKLIFVDIAVRLVEARERPRHGGKSGGRESGIASPLVKTADTAVPVDPEIGRRRTQVAVHPLQAVKGYIASRGTVPGNRSGDIAAQRPLLDGAHSNGQLNLLALAVELDGVAVVGFDPLGSARNILRLDVERLGECFAVQRSLHQKLHLFGFGHR